MSISKCFAVSNYTPLIGTERASKIKGLPRRGWNRLRHANERFDRARFLFSACLATSYLEVSRSEERKYFGASYFLERYIYFSFFFSFFLLDCNLLHLINGNERVLSILLENLPS